MREVKEMVKMKVATEVTLVGEGKKERVLLDAEAIPVQNQIFIRLDRDLIIGIISSSVDSWKSIYFWRRKGDVFHYVGDIVVMEDDGGGVLYGAYGKMQNASIPPLLVGTEEEVRKDASSPADPLMVNV